MRVATRRLRAALEIFEPCFPPKELSAALAQVKAIADALGERRDRDVAIAALEELAAGMPAPDRPRGQDADRAAAGRTGGGERGAGAVRGRGAARRPERAPLRARRGRRRQCAGRSGVKARRVKKLDPGAPLADNAARIIRVRLDEMLSFAPAALDFERIADQHDMRIAAKRLRYILETTEFCFGKPAHTARRRARDLQDLLGELHDCDVMLPRVEAHLAELRAEDAAAVREQRRRFARPRPTLGRAGPAPDRLPRPGASRGLPPRPTHPALRPVSRVLGRAGARRHLEASGAGGRSASAGCEEAFRSRSASGARAPRARCARARRRLTRPRRR